MQGQPAAGDICGTCIWQPARFKSTYANLMHMNKLLLRSCSLRSNIGFLPRALMAPALRTVFEQDASRQSDLAESTADKSARLQGLLIDNLQVVLVRHALSS